MSLWRRIKGIFGGGGEDERGAEEEGGEAPDRLTEPPARAPGPGATPGPLAGARPRGASTSPQDRTAPAAGDDDEIARLRRLGAADGPTVDEAIALLRRVRGTLRETDAVAAVLAALSERPAPDAVRVACADILATRGDDQGALRLLVGDGSSDRIAPVSSTPGLILAADLHAAQGQLPRALGAIERVLAREIDAPGALERHQRWRAALGAPRAPAGRLDEATLVAPTARGGPFRVLREVARGGAGAVYEAEDDLLGRKLAFKVYHARGSERAHLEREGRLASALAGPGVVRVYDADPTEGWVALEWVPRGSVRDVLRSGDAGLLVPISRWARPLARAIARVHARGYVHADVKPANVLLRQVHEPVLGDFGIARPMGAPSEGGSPGYVSPERLAGRASHPRDDVYGYGRVIEDVLVRAEALGAGGALPESEDVTPWRELAMRCVGPDEGRPEDGAALVRALP